MTKKVYEIFWNYTNSLGDTKILKVCEYIQTSFPWLHRDEVVSINKKKLLKTLNYLNFIAFDDEKFFIKEKKI